MQKELFEKILQLSIAERIQLVEDIWDSIAEFPEAIELSPEIKQELDRRLANMEKNPNSGILWSVVKDQSLSYYK